MKCEQVQALLVPYLDKEVTHSERTMVQAHLSDCIACRNQLALLSTMQDRIGSALQRRAAQAVSSPEAWDRLEARLAREARPSPQTFVTRLVRLAPDVHRALTLFAGGVVMRKRLGWAALVLTLALLTTAVVMVRGAAPVSAQDILDRSYAIQQAVGSDQGILHMRTEAYQGSGMLGLQIGLGLGPSLSMRVEPGSSQGQAPAVSGEGFKTIQDSYMDLQTGKSRMVVTDEKTGAVVAATAFDGKYFYSGDKPSPSGDAVQIIYRSPMPSGTPKVTMAKPLPGGSGARMIVGPVDPKSFFDAARQDPTTKFVGKETWSDGREVYVLRAEQLGKIFVTSSHGSPNLPPLTSTLYFDSKTYELVGQQLTSQQDGKETVVSSTRQLLSETLPASTAVAWDLSDLKGVKVVDDPNGEHAPKFPAPITQQELASRTRSAYILKTTPAGFDMRITAPPGVNPKGQGAYNIEYRNADGDFFQIDGGMLLSSRVSGSAETPSTTGVSGVMLQNPENVTQDADETYTTHSGLVLYFMRDPAGLGVSTGDSQKSGVKSLTHAVVKAPDGTYFNLMSNLSRDQIKTLAEGLVPLR